MKDANGFSHISPCMGRKLRKTKQRNQKQLPQTGKPVTAQRFSDLRQKQEAEKEHKGHPFPAYLFSTKRKFPKASLTTSNGVS